MRHGKKVNHLGRTASHRKAMLSNMATSLIKNKRISTTVAKAKELRKYVEPLITRSKSDTIHNRRVVFSYLQDKEAVTILFNEVSEKVASRQGGYTRIIKVGARLGDAAEMCIIELVDYNTLVLEETTEKSKSSTRRRRSKSKSTANASDGNKEEVNAEATEAKAEKSDNEESAESKNDSADDQSEKKDAE